jgi:hypothetical protein
LSNPPVVAPLPVKKKSKFNKYGPALLLILLGLILTAIPYKPDNTALQTAQQLPHLDQNQVPLRENNTTLHRESSTPVHSTHNKEKLNQRPASPISNKTIEHTGNTVYTTAKPDLTYNTEKAALANRIAAADIDSVRKPIAGEERRKPTIYWGIVFGPAINRIKNQQLHKLGYDIGIMAGISLFKGSAYVETGLLYTYKCYYSEGRYFNMDKAPMPAGMEIMSLEGSSRLFELPVKFKYKVFEKQRSASFISAGISSYLMNKEVNKYDAMMNGTPETMTDTYKDRSRYVAVMANIGAEYNYTLGKHSFLRIEPYIQIPLKGIGVGSMPVTTAGVHIGLMRFTP